MPIFSITPVVFQVRVEAKAEFCPPPEAGMMLKILPRPRVAATIAAAIAAVICDLPAGAAGVDAAAAVCVTTAGVPPPEEAGGVSDFEDENSLMAKIEAVRRIRTRNTIVKAMTLTVSAPLTPLNCDAGVMA